MNCLQLRNVLGSVFRKGTIAFSPDGTVLYSPVGNRLFAYDLKSNISFTFPFELHKNLTHISISPNGKWLFVCDEDGRASLITVQSRAIVHQISLKSPVSAVSFSPCGTCVALALKLKHRIQIWRIFPSSSQKSGNQFPFRSFNAFTLLKTIAGHHDIITSVSWNHEGTMLLSSSKDMTVRISSIGCLSSSSSDDDNNVENEADEVEEASSKTRGKFLRLCGHRDAVVGAFWNNDCSSVYSVTRDGLCYLWNRTDSENSSGLPRYELSAKHFFSESGSLGDGPIRVKTVKYHAGTQMLVVGFSHGVFGLWELPDFSMVHSLSVGRTQIDSLDISCGGEWLAFGSSQLGQLVVWEWQSETYVLKQQGHSAEMQCLSYSPDGQVIATGGMDGKVKLWSITDGFCFATFTEHTAAVTGIEFAGKHGGKQGVVFSSGLDGTVRAFDTKRFRHFRVFTAPTPVQFSCVAVDPSGEIVCAGSNDTFEIYVWSVQTGNLLDVLVGHEGPISCLAFSCMDSASGTSQSYYSSNQLLVSGSWDKKARVWDLFSRGSENKCTEVLDHTSEIVSLALRPDGKEVCVSTIDGKITIWNLAAADAGMTATEILGRADISGGRKDSDMRTASTIAKSAYYTTMAYTADGKRIIAGSSSRWVCMYDLMSRCLLKKISLTKNYSLDGIKEMLNSKRMTEAGALSLIDDNEDFDYNDSARANNELEKARARLEVKSSCIRFSPSGDTWSVCTTEGVSIYGSQNNVIFDPLDLDMDITPESTVHYVRLAEKHESDWLVPLIMALRLNEFKLLQLVVESIPWSETEFVIKQLPLAYLGALLEVLYQLIDRDRSSMMDKQPSRHLQHNISFLCSFLETHWKNVRTLLASPPTRGSKISSISTLLGAIKKSVIHTQSDLSSIVSSNLDMVSFLISNE